jgi:hypothetical protein
MSDPALDSHIRQIRNIQIGQQDLEPLLPGETKLPSTTINAYGAFAQQTEQQLPNTADYFVILSSWLGPPATERIKDGGNEGSFEGHVLAAVCCYHSTFMGERVLDIL